MCKIALLVLGIVSLCSVCSAKMREFTDNKGGKMVAEIISVKGAVVKVRRQDNQIFNIEKDRFSAADLKFIKSWEQKTYFPKLTADTALNIIVNAVKNEKRNFTDHDNETIEIYPTVKIFNQELYAHFTNIHATVILLGKNTHIKNRTLKVLSKESFTFSIEPDQRFEWQGTTITSKFDDKQRGRFGYEYYGYVFYLKNQSGEIVYAKAPAQWITDDEHHLQLLQAHQTFNPYYK